MTRERARTEVRGWVMTNYGFTLFAVMIPALFKALNPNWLWAALIILVTLAGIVFSQDRAFGRTGLWSLTHAKPNTLDERERAVTHQALATSYSWITIIMMIAIYLIFLSHDQMFARYLAWTKPIAPVLGMALIYVAHTMPAAILGWKQLPAEDDAGEKTQPA
jgi:hypothetical protein